ncbi:MAG: glycoside hydrolase family 3 N-terminal domain-containing protein [Myxococcota bacterium]
MHPRVGHRFILGFRGTTLPEWLRRFEAEHGLGGVILFDTDVESGRPERNIESPEQVKALCGEVHGLQSGTRVFVDQEGGRVRRLKPERGFAPLPSAFEFSRLSLPRRYELVRASFGEMADLGIDFNLGPVIDLNTNPENPSIGALGRSFSDDPAEIRENVAILAEVAQDVGLGLCLKHYPGLGGATTDTHEASADLTGRVSEEQLRLFTDLAPSLPGSGILLSHGRVQDWDPECPVSVSATAVGQLRAQVPEALLITDDLQMQGLQQHFGTAEASLRAIRAGVDLICLANNTRGLEVEALEAIRETARWPGLFRTPHPG